ncbi:MAG: hypothetical protein KJO82_10390 [Gammaproteobacteria bacterium]|nr:hypothetical protein [Gammaproteobacteria bacterium]
MKREMHTLKNRITSVASCLSVMMLSACGGGGGGDALANGGTGECSQTAQKQFVLDAMLDWYLWNDLLPTNVDVNDYTSPESLLAFLSTFSPDDGFGNSIDRFSSINTAAADSAFFGEGQFEGFGFSSRFVAADDLRLTRVFSSSPAFDAGLERGQRIVELDGRTIAQIEAAEGVGAVFDTSPLEFRMRETNGNEFVVSITQGLVTIDPVPQSRIIPLPGTPGIGYIELATFISTADPEFDTVFGQFAAAGVSDVIVDLRYNGGGLVSTAELLGDYLGGIAWQNLVFSETLFNADRSAANDDVEFFELRGNSVNLQRLVIIASSNTASASELVTNSVDAFIDVVIVGDDTFGKPVGQIGLEFCEQILRPTSFQTVNANGFGDYFDGLPVDCPATDDLSIPVGANNDPNIEAADEFLSAGSCPTAAAPGGVSKPVAAGIRLQNEWRGPAWREFAGAY